MVVFGFYWDINPDPMVFMLGFGDLNLGPEIVTSRSHFGKILVCMESWCLGDEQNPDPHISKLGPGMCFLGPQSRSHKLHGKI
jgi:hypothetical protein